MTDTVHTRRWLAILLSTILIAVIVGYGYFEARRYLTGPEMIIDYPANGSTLYDDLLTIEGRARNVSRLTLDGRQIFTDEHGVFKERLVLATGYNVILAQAEDRFGRSTNTKLEVVLKQSASSHETATSTGSGTTTLPVTASSTTVTN